MLDSDPPNLDRPRARAAQPRDGGVRTDPLRTTDQRVEQHDAADHGGVGHAAHRGRHGCAGGEHGSERVGELVEHGMAVADGKRRNPRRQVTATGRFFRTQTLT
jgi:hypothetical protein